MNTRDMTLLATPATVICSHRTPAALMELSLSGVLTAACWMILLVNAKPTFCPLQAPAIH